MEMEMVRKVLRPSVQHGNKPEFAAKAPLWVFGKCLQRFINRSKQEFQGYSFVAEYNRIKLMGQGKDQMKIAAGKQFGLAVI